jgi:hypothetical protein
MKRARADIDKYSKVPKLKDACINYLQHLLSEMGVKGKRILDFNEMMKSPVVTKDSNQLLRAKYAAVYDILKALNKITPGENEEASLKELHDNYMQKPRQALIAEHRNNAGIQFLNLIFSILSLGTKNLISYSTTQDGYWGFWSSRGEKLNEDLKNIINKSPLP